MKITPSNQTLILGVERRGRGARAGNSSAKTAVRPATSGSVLQRVTIVAARPDSTVVYLRADYSPATPLVVGQSASATRDAYGNAFSSRIGTQGKSSYLNPVEQYAQTQRILGAAPRVSQIDVHA